MPAGDITFNVMPLSASGRHPEPKAEGSKLTIGGQTVAWSDGTLLMAKSATPLPIRRFVPEW